MTRWLLGLLLAAPYAAAHVVSMSTGEATLKGAQLDYELRMPLYEVSHAGSTEALLANIHFIGGGDEARLIRQECREESGNMVCRGMWLFPREVEEFKVRCTYPSITVPNHVHLFRAVNGSKTDQAAFDGSFTEAELRFRPPTAIEVAAHDSGAGFWRGLAGPAQILFLFALLLAATSWSRLGALFASFAAGQVIGAVAMSPAALGISARFIEAAAALTIAYLAVELLLLPTAGARWAVAGILGLFHGLYFSMLLAGGDYRPAPFLAGAVAAEALVAGLGWLGVRRLPFQKALASVLFCVGLGWFLLRLKS